MPSKRVFLRLVAACYCRLLLACAKTCCSPWALRRGQKGKPSSVNKTFSSTELKSR